MPNAYRLKMQQNALPTHTIDNRSTVAEYELYERISYLLCSVTSFAPSDCLKLAADFLIKSKTLGNKILWGPLQIFSGVTKVRLSIFNKDKKNTPLVI